jgi:hypothetical protein
MLHLALERAGLFQQESRGKIAGRMGLTIVFFSCVTDSNVMSSNGRRKDARAELTALELSVFSVLKGSGNATAGQIRSALPWSSEAKGVRAALLRLEECGLLTHSIASGQIFYHSAAPLESAVAKVLQSADQSGSEPESL